MEVGEAYLVCSSDDRVDELIVVLLKCQYKPEGFKHENPRMVLGLDHI